MMHAQSLECRYCDFADQGQPPPAVQEVVYHTSVIVCDTCTAKLKALLKTLPEPTK